jgi:hypothetical protein
MAHTFEHRRNVSYTLGMEVAPLLRSQYFGDCTTQTGVFQHNYGTEFPN